MPICAGVPKPAEMWAPWLSSLDRPEPMIATHSSTPTATANSAPSLRTPATSGPSGSSAPPM